MSWNITAHLNPEFVRGMRISLPRRRAVFVAALTAAILLAGGWLLWSSNAPSSYYNNYDAYWAYREAEHRAAQTQNFGRQAFGALTVTLFGLLFILAPAMAGLSFVQERLRGTAIFQQMNLLSPHRFAAGKFMTSGVLAYFIAAMLLPCAAVAASLGHVDAGKVVRLYLFLFVGGLCWQAVGLAVSVALAAPAERPLRGGMLIGPLVGLGGAVTALALNDYFVRDMSEIERGSSYEGYYTWHFFDAEAPAYAVILGLLAFAGVSAFVGAVGRIKSWQLIPTKPHAFWLFFASAEALLVGVLWGRHAGDTLANERLVIYMLLNWVALAALAGGSALGRGRLREWWSAERDPVAVFQRGEIKNALKTFLVALGISLAGLVALWVSYHVYPDGSRGSLMLMQLFPIAFGFAATMLGMAAFIQFSAMYRFRIGGWAGLALTAIFYVFVTIAGVMFHDTNKTPALFNPLVYAEVATKGDYYMDSRFNTTRGEYIGGRYIEVPVVNPDYETNSSPRADVDSARALGFFAQGLLAFFCFGLAYMKWTRTREEMLRGDAAES